MNDTRKERKRPELVMELIQLLQKCGEVYGQKRVFNRAQVLVMAEIMGIGRQTVTQLLVTMGLTKDDWSAWYRLFSEQRYKEEETSGVMVQEMLKEVPTEEPFVIGVDGFPVPRSSQKMPGTSWMPGLRTARFRPGIQRMQRFVGGAWLPPLVNGYARAIPVRCLPAFTAKAEPSAAGPSTEVAAGLEIVSWTRRQMDEAGRSEQLLMTLQDGRYDTLNFWPGLPERTIAVVRTARNRCLFSLPAEDAHGNRRYGDKAPAPHTWLKKRKGFRLQDVWVRGRIRSMRYRVQGPYVRDGLHDIPLFLIVVGGGKRPKGSRRKAYNPCFFLVSALLVDGVWSLPLPIAQLLAWLWQRWELEVAHRQMKSGLGLGEKQCWNSHATVASVQWSAWIYSLMMLAGHRTWRHTAGPRPPGRWRKTPQRWSFNSLWRSLRTEMWHHPLFRTTWIQSRDNWPENEALWLALFNSLLAPARF